MLVSVYIPLFLFLLFLELSCHQGFRQPHTINLDFAAAASTNNTAPLYVLFFSASLVIKERVSEEVKEARYKDLEREKDNMSKS
jgi:hypothetical protein